MVELVESFISRWSYTGSSQRSYSRKIPASTRNLISLKTSLGTKRANETPALRNLVRATWRTRKISPKIALSLADSCTGN